MPSYRKRGGVWRAEIARKGIRKSGTFNTKAEAVAWATAEEAKIMAGKVTADHTVAELLRRYVTMVSPKKANRNTKFEYNRVEALIRDYPELAAKKLSDVRAADWAAWRDDRLNGNGERKAVAGSTVSRDLNLFSAAFMTAKREWGWIHESPISGVSRPRDPQPRSRRPEQDEIDRICLALGYTTDEPPETATARCGAAYLFAIETAMRAGEIVGLRPQDIHKEKRYAHLPRTKNGSARSVPLSSRALAIIEQLEPLGHDPLFGLTSSQLDALFRKGRDRAGVEGLTFHDSRREGLTRLAKIFNVMELAKISGHRDLRILQNVYYAPTAEDLAERLA
ncbi:site-specific integrase [Cupriavidus taiwanensis]|uniref:tyrosine-type recombinase/integrase n=1 Tax=Cupriavidus taiwanensis TaxID=164546 RepID=UPI001574E1DA|nr:site-specific integrase [Cupriavidus taiwanensis]NSX15589.1 site-specific integrase [Cupriavidus taiwanensis]